MLVTFIMERTDDILISKKNTYKHKLKKKKQIADVSENITRVF